MAAGGALVEVTVFTEEDEKEAELVEGAASSRDGEMICIAAKAKRNAGIRFRKVTLSLSLIRNELERTRSYRELEQHLQLDAFPP